MEPSTIYYTLAGLVGLVTVANTVLIKPLRDRVTSLEEKLQEHVYTKTEVGEQIDFKMRPLNISLDSLNNTITALTKAVESLDDSVGELKMWREREIGRGERGNGQR